MLTIGSLFSGIGGLERGLEMAGLGPVVYQVESDPFCRAVLERHWPGVPRYEDVRTLPALPPADLICGGFPCTDISSAGKGAGLAGERSGLWFEFARVVEAARPRWVVVENVASGAKRWVDQVCARLGQLGYEVLPIPLSAQDVGAPHIRRRIFVVAHAVGKPVRKQPGRDRREGGQSAPLAGLAGEDGAAADPNGIAEREQDDQAAAELHGRPGARAAARSRSRDAVTDADNTRCDERPGVRGDSAGRPEPPDGPRHPNRDSQPAELEHDQVAGLRGLARDPPPWATAPEFCRVDDGLPSWVGRRSSAAPIRGPRRANQLRALGNAVVPQCAEVIGHVVRELAGLPEAPP